MNSILHYFVVYVKKKENIFGIKVLIYFRRTCVSWKHRLRRKVTFCVFLLQNVQLAKYFFELVKIGRNAICPLVIALKRGFLGEKAAFLVYQKNAISQNAFIG
jgi:hypothetical protein